MARLVLFLPLSLFVVALAASERSSAPILARRPLRPSSCARARALRARVRASGSGTVRFRFLVFFLFWYLIRRASVSVSVPNWGVLKESARSGWALINRGFCHGVCSSGYQRR